MIRNMEEKGKSDWDTNVIGKPFRIIEDRYQTCILSVEALEVNGNINFKVGLSDVRDIVNEAIARYGGSGRVGARGEMRCNGNIKSQRVRWGLY